MLKFGAYIIYSTVYGAIKELYIDKSGKYFIY